MSASPALIPLPSHLAARARLESLVSSAREALVAQPLNVDLRLAVIRAQNLLAHVSRPSATRTVATNAKVLAFPSPEEPKTTILKVREIKALFPKAPKAKRERASKAPKAAPIKLVDRWGAACRERAIPAAWNPKAPKSLPALLETPEWKGAEFVRTEEHVTAAWGPIGYETSFVNGGVTYYNLHESYVHKGCPVYGPALDSRTTVDVYRHPCGAELRIKHDAKW